MSKKRDLPEGRKSEDYRDAANDSLELAKVLAGTGPHQRPGLSRTDGSQRRTGGPRRRDVRQCHNMILGAQVAREMIEAGEYEDVVSKWAAEARRRWEESKFFKLWQEEKQAGRDPHQAFKERGWEP